MNQAKNPEGTLRLLVVDDEKDIVDLLARRLSRRGFEVTGAYSLDAAKQYLEEEHFDVVICDLNLGSFSGLDLFQSFSQNSLYSNSRFIFLSGVADRPPAIIQIEKDGGCEFLRKPVDFQLLISLIKGAVDNQKAG